MSGYSKKKNTRKRTTTPNIQHHHVLIRCEIEAHLTGKDKPRLKRLLEHIITDIDMKHLGAPEFYYIAKPNHLSGLSAIAPIRTSHIALHFWNYPEREILHHSSSRTLLQMDIYTCNQLENSKIIKVLELLSQFTPTHIEFTLLNRKKTLSIQHHTSWILGGHNPWLDWVASQKFV